jgi:hypothetical protein
MYLIHQVNKLWQRRRKWESPVDMALDMVQESERDPKLLRKL